jgi:hypothetical protein
VTSSNVTVGVATLSALEAVGVGNLAGKVLVDIALPLDGEPGQPRSLVVANTDSLGDQIQRAFPGTQVVKTLNTVFVDVMVDPGRVPRRHDIFVSGDDPEAKRTVAALLRILAGTRTRSWISATSAQPGGGDVLRPLLHPRSRLGTFDINIAIIRSESSVADS